MGKLAERICNGISRKFYERVEEICRAIPECENYEVSFCKNIGVLKGNIFKHSKDVSGYRHIDHSIVPLTNNIFFSRRFTVEGDFAMVKVRSRAIDPTHNQVVESKIIYVYEKKEDPSFMLARLVL